MGTYRATGTSSVGVFDFSKVVDRVCHGAKWLKNELPIPLMPLSPPGRIPCFIIEGCILSRVVTWKLPPRCEAWVEDDIILVLVGVS